MKRSIDTLLSKRGFELTTRLTLFICIFLMSIQGKAQLTGTKTVGGTSPDYATLTAAITALNTNGVGTGGVTFSVRGGFSETLSATLVVTATGTSSNPITFQWDGNGAKPILIAPTGTVTWGTTSTSWYLGFSRFRLCYYRWI